MNSNAALKIPKQAGSGNAEGGRISEDKRSPTKDNPKTVNQNTKKYWKEARETGRRKQS